MNLIILATATFLLIGANNGEETETKSLDLNTTILPRKAGFRFEDEINNPYQNDNSKITFEEQAAPFKFEGNPTIPEQNTGPVTFQDDNKIKDTGHKKKKRRRRRKPRFQVPDQHPGPVQGPYLGYPGQLLPGQPSYPGPGQAYPDGGGFGPGVRPVGQFYRPHRRPKQSFASEALSKVTGALTSIALYDDYQCVPRLLCEAAGGGALGTSNVLQSVAGLQPLLTLLSAYSGISTSPLFVFGRAVFLGMTSKGNTASCRYAYPQCPTDPEQLVYYLNNHNGGFFRFFNSPQIPQNLEQFYNQLSGYGFPQNQQNNGLYDPQGQPQQSGYGFPQNQQNYGHYDQSQAQYPVNPQLNQNFQNQQQNDLHGPQNYNGQNGPYNPQQYDLYDPQLQNPGQQFGPQNPQQNGYYQPNTDQQNYGFYHPQYYQIPQQNPYGLYNQFSGPQNQYANKYSYKKKRKPNNGKYGFGNVNYKDNSAEGNRIQKRIQNKPNYLYVDTNIDNDNESSVSNFKFVFPDHKKSEPINNYVRGGKNLKFPEENISVDYIVTDEDSNKRKAKSIIFPEIQDYKFVNYYEYPPKDGDDLGIQYPNYNVGYVVSSNSNYNSHGYNVKDDIKFNNNFNDDDQVQTVYIVRDDPNNPEIVKIRKGQKVY